MHFGLLKVSDMVHVNEEGVRIGGADLAVNAAGFTIHAAIHKARPDINAACHVHSPYGRAWSNFGRSIDMLNQGEHLMAEKWDIVKADTSYRFLHVL